eukprot:TRINITY_DN5740_c0_g1_i9.p1 TRINITY_DN5740_c0_g1~~TRINITY_DN5740_c0_g1_i9.p1  ORF type:complete len:205 (+),score=10.74 TRINITY_DN5740_c0_g1_i9:30-644(+)
MNQQTVRFLASVVAVSIQPLHALSECEGRAEGTKESFELYLSMQSFTTKFEIADTLVTSNLLFGFYCLTFRLLDMFNQFIILTLLVISVFIIRAEVELLEQKSVNLKQDSGEGSQVEDFIRVNLQINRANTNNQRRQLLECTGACATIEKAVLIASKLCLMIVGGITVAITIFVHRKTILKYLYCCLTCRKVRSNMTSITCQEP